MRAPGSPPLPDGCGARRVVLSARLSLSLSLGDSRFLVANLAAGMPPPWAAGRPADWLRVMSRGPRDLCGTPSDHPIAAAYALCLDKWLRFARWFVGDMKAEGLVHNLVLDIWEHKGHDFATPEDVERYVMASIPNRARDHHRRTRRWASIEHLQAPREVAGCSPETIAHAIEAGRKLFEVLLEVLRVSPPVQGDVLVLRLLGCNGAEIASIQGTAATTSRTRLSRVCARFRAALAEVLSDGSADDSDPAIQVFLALVRERFGPPERYTHRWGIHASDCQPIQ